MLSQMPFCFDSACCFGLEWLESSNQGLLYAESMPAGKMQELPELSRNFFSQSQAVTSFWKQAPSTFYYACRLLVTNQVSAWRTSCERLCLAGALSTTPRLRPNWTKKFVTPSLGDCFGFEGFARYLCLRAPAENRKTWHQRIMDPSIPLGRSPTRHAEAACLS